MRYLILLGFIFSFSESFAQRYLTDEFPLLDSIIGGTYGSAENYLGEDQDLLYDFYAPKDDALEKRPLIIYMHGGGFVEGSRSYPSVKLLSRKLAMKGYAVANIDYRLTPGFEMYNSNEDRRAMTDAMHDAKQAIRYFKASADAYKLDTTRFFIGGESAGAITAMMAAYVDKQEELIPYPMANPNDPVGSNSNDEYSNAVSGVLCLCGWLLDPTAMEGPSDPPLLWTHGSADPLIPIEIAVWVPQRAEEIGLPIQTKIYEAATHCPWYYGNPQWETYMDSTITDITSFLYPMVAPVLGLEDLKPEIPVSIFPNPASDQFVLELDRRYSDIRIIIMGASGKVYEKRWFKNQKSPRIDTSHLPEGLFLLRVEIDKHQAHTKRVAITRR